MLLFGTEFRLGPFLVDAAGQLSPRELDRPPRFSLRCWGKGIRAQLDDGRLALEATVGRVPSTALLGKDASPRERVFALLRSVAEQLAPAWRLRLAADHRVQITTECTLARPPTAVALLTEVTGFLIDLQPVLDLLDATGLLSPLRECRERAAEPLEPAARTSVIRA
jgi:hypothetical protein